MHHWFKSYSDFAKVVNFAYWWSCIGKGLRSPGLPRLVSAKLDLYDAGPHGVHHGRRVPSGARRQLLSLGWTLYAHSHSHHTVTAITQ